MNPSLLVELCTEELPPKALEKLGHAFAGVLLDELRAHGVAAPDAPFVSYASPRRLGVHVRDVLSKAPDRLVDHKLMPVAVGLDADARPTQPLLNKISALGADPSTVSSLRRREIGKREFLFLEIEERGDQLSVLLQRALDKAIAELPIPKVMSYQLGDGWTTVHFVRPVHRLVALHGAEVVPISAFGLQAERETLGHRFKVRQRAIELRNADSYAEQLREEGTVIANFGERRAEIARQLSAVASMEDAGLTPIDDPDLLDEVTGLVEYPSVLYGTFDQEFLRVPSECLILTMKANQKYFPLLKRDGSLSNHFLVVSNAKAAEPKEIVNGNERVLRARLADARFFFDQDRKVSLVSRLPRLAEVVYHNKLGSQAQRVERIGTLARGIAAHLGDNAFVADVGKTASLAKADLLTDMVGEFPELQGIMGGHYARREGLGETIALAIEDHYRPRFATDDLPRNLVGVVVALADKVEAVVGLFGIGQVPTGDRDPYALRRCTVGIIRLLMERELALDVDALVRWAVAAFGNLLDDDPTALVLDYLNERLTQRLRDQGYTPQEVEAVLSLRPRRLGEVPHRLEAVRSFWDLPEAADLAGAHRRVRNILAKVNHDETAGLVNAELFESEVERDLFAALNEIGARTQAAFSDRNYRRALQILAELRTPIDRFFVDVLVNTDKDAIRKNRLALLSRLSTIMNRVADISKLTVQHHSSEEVPRL